MSVREVEVDRDGVIVNETDVPTSQVLDAIYRDPKRDPIVAEMVKWARNAQTPQRNRNSIVYRDRFISPNRPMDQMRMAREAMGDDVVGGVADTTENLAFKKTELFTEDESERDGWNQWAEEVDVDSRLREQWRTLFSDAHVVTAMLWGRMSFNARGKTAAGVAKRKGFDAVMPTDLTVLDTLKIAPVGTMLFGRERLAYIADWDEALAFDSILAMRDGTAEPIPSPTGEVDMSDDIVARLVIRRYRPERAERMLLERDGVDCNHLFLLDQNSVWRHTLTKRGSQRFSDIRMRDVFPLLDLKQQQQAKDRSFLVAGTSFLIVITKGSDLLPAQPNEIANLEANIQVIAQQSVLVGDHRLEVKIVAPPQDHVLEKARYDTPDVRIAARLYQTFVPTGADETDPLKLGKVIAEGLESRRLMLRRAWERYVFKQVLARNPHLNDKPIMLFHPEQISLAFDAGWASFLLDMRAANELSRDTLLSNFGMSQWMEARRREQEEKEYDPIFKTITPHGANNPITTPPGDAGAGAPQDPKTAGRTQGGRRNGGGAAPGKGAGQPPRNPRRKSDGGKP